jgi:hypothetical protein
MKKMIFVLAFALLTCNVVGATNLSHIDIVRVYDNSIVGDDTIPFVFAFVPAKIVLTYSGRSTHDTTFERGFVSGEIVITITGTDTYSVAGGANGLYNNNGTLNASTNTNGTVNIIFLFGGNDGVDTCNLYATTVSSTWTTATKTLLLDFDNYANLFNGGVSIVATAYK